MRIPYIVLATSLLAAGPLYAQAPAPQTAPMTTAPATTAPMTAAPATDAPAAPDASATAPAATPAPTKPATKAATHARAHMTAAQRFEAANTTGDGHLTKEQAKGHLAGVYRHFDAIDKDHKGYVTQDDIKAYYAAQRAAHHTTKTSAKPATSN